MVTMMPVPVMPPMPVAIVTDAAWAVMGPDHAAAAIGIIIVGAVVRIVVGAVEVPMVMMEVRPIGEAAVIAAVPDATTVVECRTGAEAATMEGRRCVEATGAQSAAMEATAADMNSSTVETSSTDRGSATAETASADVDRCTASSAVKAAATTGHCSATETTTTTAAVEAATTTATAGRPAAHLDRDDVRG